MGEQDDWHRALPHWPHDEVDALIASIQAGAKTCCDDQANAHGCSMYLELQNHMEGWLHLWEKARNIIVTAVSLENDSEPLRSGIDINNILNNFKNITLS